MAKGRMLKKVICTSKKLADLKSDSARLLYTWLLPHLDIEGRFSGDPNIIKGYICPRLNHITKKKIERYLQELAENKLIIVYRASNDLFLQFIEFHKHQSLRRDREAESDIPAPEDGELLYNSGITPTQVKLSKVNISKVNSRVEEIINYLNKKSKKNFRSTTIKTIDLIKARFNEKFTIEDFKKVIDVKTKQWFGNEEFEGFLRPETLFGNKFEGYLNEHKDKKPIIKTKFFKAEDEDKSKYVPMPEHFKKIFKKGIKKIEDKKKVFNG